MVRYSVFFCILFSAAVLTAKAEKKPGAVGVRFDPVTKNIQGWTVYVQPSMLNGENAKAGAEQLSMLGNHLQRIKILLPEKQLKIMQTLEIWIEQDHPTLGNMQYHPG
jgi:hypothetical protein